MLVLKSLILQNIGRFVEPQTIDFAQLGSLVQVDGVNLNTGGSSGAAKSTIFKALEFLLGLNDISNSVLQSRLTKEPMSVSGLFELDSIPLKIERNKKLLIDLNGEVITGSSKLTEEKLDEVIGMPRDLFRKIMHKRQGEGGFFLDMGPSEVHKFLTSCLGLEKEQTKIVTLDTRLTALNETLLALKSTLESNKMGLEATQSAIATLGPSPVLDINPEAIEGLRIKHLEAQNNTELFRNAIKKEIEELEKIRPQIVSAPFDRSGIVEHENSIAQLKNKIAEYEKVEQNRQSEVKTKISELQIQASQLNNAELTRQSEVKNKVSSIRVEISKLQSTEQSRQQTVKSAQSALQIELFKLQAKVSTGRESMVQAVSLGKELQKVRSAVCPTCEQGWVTDACKAKEAEILAKLSEYKKDVVAGNEALSKITLVDQQIQELIIEAQPRDTLEINALNFKISELNKDILPRIVPEVAELNYKIESLKQEAQPIRILEILELNKEIFTINSLLDIERKNEKDHQFNENAKSQLILVNYAQKQTELRKSHESTLKFVLDAENEALANYQHAKNRVSSFEEAKKRFDDSLNRLNGQLSGYSGQLEAKTKELKLVEEEIELATESKKAIKSYLSCSFEDALDSIGDTATRFIRSIPNMQTATIQFEGLKETKEGKVKEEVNCVISMDGEIGIPVKSLSGGERSSTDLAIDLAVIKFIEERTGKGIDIMILDEPFTGLDSKNIIEALEMLKECSVDKRLIIVDHNIEAAQFVENKLTVVRDGLTSKIVQQ